MNRDQLNVWAFNVGDSVITINKVVTEGWYNVNCIVIDRWIHKGDNMYLLDNKDQDVPKVFKEKDLTGVNKNDLSN